MRYTSIVVQGEVIKEAEWMRQKHEEVDQFQDFESIESELDRGHSIRERTAISSRDTAVTMLRQPHSQITRVKSDELAINYSERFFSYGAIEDYNKEEQNARILIAQYEPEILNLLIRFLNGRGINISSATNATDAYNQFQKRNRSNKPFETIVLDTHLPGNSGLTLANKIHQTNPQQRIIVITTTPKHLLHPSLRKVGFLREKDILTMPFRLMDLASRLGEIGQGNSNESRVFNNIISNGN